MKLKGLKSVLFVFLMIVLVSCGEMQREQWKKERQAVSKGILRNIRVYEQSVLVWEFNGYCNLEGAWTQGFLSIAEKTSGGILMHKIKTSYQTLVIVEEKGGK